MRKTIYLIDGTAYIHRAYHAIRNLTNSRGFPTNAVYGFTRMLIKLLEDRNPQYIGILFDTKGPTFRHKMFEKYKANRPPMPEDMALQIPYIKEITSAFNLSQMEMPGFEADDLIGTLACKAEKTGFEVVMVTGDKDFMQLVTDRITIWDPMKEKVINPDTIRSDMGVEPGQLIDVMGLSGDTADNIPGVPGVGPKTALKLIKTFGSLIKLYDRVDTIVPKRQHENLVNFKKQAFLSQQLVTIDTRAPVDFEPEHFIIKKPNNTSLARLFKKLEFRQLQKAYPEKSDLGRKNYRAVMDENDLAKLIARLQAAEIFALDTETTSKHPMVAGLVGLSFAITPHEAFYIPCGHHYPGAVAQLDRKIVLDQLKPVLENPDLKKIGQNIKYDWIVLLRHGIDLKGVTFDTMLASYLLNPSKRAHGLDQIALDFLNHTTISYQDVAGKGKATGGFARVPLEKATPYACEDADITLMAKNILARELDNANLTDLFKNVEMPLIPVLMSMEMQGVSVDRERLQDLSKSLEMQLEALEKEIYSIAGEQFNINSSQQLSHILFDKLGLPTQKKTKKKTGYSTDVDVLTTLAQKHELPALILRYRTLAKLKSTYTDALPELIHPDTGRIHTSYNQTVTATGRLSSSDPNLQNIPIRTTEGREIRSAFIPRKGWSFVAADYSQIELRILAHCSDDQILIKAFKDDEDIHTRTAAEVFQVFPSFIDKELRQQAKAINFGIIYGQSAFGLSKQIGVSRKMAQTYINNYFAQYSGVKQFIDKTIEQARQTMKTSTLLGRIRLLPDIASSNATIRKFAERTAINTPIQGTAADLIKLAMIQTAAALRKKNLKSVMLLSVHDEIVFEVPPGELETVKALAKDVMEGIWDLKVPLKVNVAEGDNWARAH